VADNPDATIYWVKEYSHCYVLMPDGQTGNVYGHYRYLSKEEILRIGKHIPVDPSDLYLIPGYDAD
jgi:hypothetical protein